MTYKEAIGIIEIAQAEVEWNYPLSYAIAFEKAIEVLKEKAEKEEHSIMCDYYKQIVLHDADGEILTVKDICLDTDGFDPCSYANCFLKCARYVPQTKKDNCMEDSDDE